MAASEDVWLISSDGPEKQSKGASGPKETFMRCDGKDQKERTMAAAVESMCHDHFPHLCGDFTTCTKPCTKPQGHRPATPHRCADGHEWCIDVDAFLNLPQTHEP